jgi:hypothetical protein
MTEVSQYSFELKELAIMLLKREKIKVGKWVIGFEFNMGAGLIGLPSPDNPRPAAFLAINKVVLTRHVEGTPEPPYIVDATEIKS